MDETAITRQDIEKHKPLIDCWLTKRKRPSQKRWFWNIDLKRQYPTAARTFELNNLSIFLQNDICQTDQKTNYLKIRNFLTGMVYAGSIIYHAIAGRRMRPSLLTLAQAFAASCNSHFCQLVVTDEAYRAGWLSVVFHYRHRADCDTGDGMIAFHYRTAPEIRDLSYSSTEFDQDFLNVAAMALASQASYVST